MSNNKLPIYDLFNIKRLVIEGLESKIAELGQLNQPIIVSTDYPSVASNPTNASGDTVPYRRIVVKRMSTVPNANAIGDIYASLNNTHEYDLEGVGVGDLRDVVAEGWFEDHTIEISVWCREPDDRDNLLELLRMFMLELNHRNLDNGAPYFYNNRVYAVRFNRAYESQDVKFIADTVHYVGALEYSLSSPVYGTTIEEYEKIKISIISELDPGKDGVVIVKPDHPHFPGGGGGNEGTIPDVYVSPKESYGTRTDDGKSKEVLFVGGPLKTDGGALIEHIFKELEDDD